MADVEKPGILENLRRRSVFRVGAMYVVAAWVLLQVADVLADPLSFPDWFQTTLIGALAIGFPITLALAWVFDVTPDGVVRSTEDSRLELVRLRRAHKIDYAIIGTLIIALALSYLRESGRVESESVSEMSSVETNTVDEIAPSIAVLSFVNMSADDETGFFSAGLSEDILNELSADTSLKVASRTSSFQFSGRNQGVPFIAEQLGVSYVLEGSVRKIGSRLRIAAQLIRARDNFHLWSENYDREFEDLFNLQTILARKIAHFLRANIENDLFNEQLKKLASDPKAFEYYLKSINQWRQIALGHGGDWELMLEYSKKATELDPEFVPAYIQRAFVYMQRVGGRLTVEEASPLAHAAIAKAIELDPHNMYTYLQLGQIYMVLDLDYQRAEVTFQQGLVRYPENAWYHANLGEILLRKGRISEGLAKYRTAIEIGAGFETSPLLIDYGINLLFDGNYSEALRVFDQALTITTEGKRSAELKLLKAQAFVRLDDRKSAQLLIDEAWEIAGSTNPEIFAMVFALMGQTERATEILNHLLVESEDRQNENARVFFFTYLALQDMDEAYVWLNKAIRLRDIYVILTMRSRFVDELREDSRFIEAMMLLEKMESDHAAAE